MLHELLSVKPWHLKTLRDSELRLEYSQHSFHLSQNGRRRVLDCNLNWYRRQSRHRVLSARHLSLPRR